MNKQRFSIFVLAVLGMISTLLPWYSVDDAMRVNGISFFIGWLIFIMFGVVMLLALRKSLHEDIHSNVQWAISVLSIMAGVIALWRALEMLISKDRFYTLSEDLIGIPAMLVNLNYGIWLTIVAGFAIPLAAILFKTRQKL